MVTTVTIDLYDGNERAGFEKLIRDIEVYRKHKYAEEEAAELAAETQEAADTPVIDFVPQEPAPAPAEMKNVPTEDQLRDALRAYLKKTNLQETMNVLGKHGVSKITDDMTPEVRVSLYEELTRSE